MRIRLQTALLALVACQSNPNVPGQKIGSFNFSATPVSSDCPFIAAPPLDPSGAFTFQGTLSRDPISTQAYFILGSVERNATFDGQIFTSEATASRNFIECNCDAVSVDETLRVALLSMSQDDALGHRCPPNPLDGGVPVNPDAGISPPCPTSDTCNAVRACGELIDAVIPGSRCQCSSCTMSFSVEGEKR